MTPKKGRQLLHVCWLDALTSNGWGDDVADTTPMAVQSVGWLLLETKDALILAADTSPDQKQRDTNRRIAIPKAWITSRRVIRL